MNHIDVTVPFGTAKTKVNHLFKKIEEQTNMSCTLKEVCRTHKIIVPTSSSDIYRVVILIARQWRSNHNPNLLTRIVLN